MSTQKATIAAVDAVNVPVNTSERFKRQHAKHKFNLKGRTVEVLADPNGHLEVSVSKDFGEDGLCEYWGANVTFYSGRFFCQILRKSNKTEEQDPDLTEIDVMEICTLVAKHLDKSGLVGPEDHAKAALQKRLAVAKQEVFKNGQP